MERMESTDWDVIGRSVPEAGPRAEARLPDICRPNHQVSDHLHGPKNGEQLLCELFVVGVQVGALVHIIEGQLALLIVQVHPNLPGRRDVTQRRGGYREGLQINAPLQAEGQVACISVERAEAPPGC